MITSLQNERVKRTAKLRDSRPRRAAGLFLIDGMRELQRALAAGIDVVELFVAPHADSALAAVDLCAASARPPEVIEVIDRVMEKLCYGQRNTGFLAVAKTPHQRLEDFAPPANALIAVVEGVEKPGNFGAILRTADGAGLHAVLVTDPASDLYNPNAIRASLGTIFSLPVFAGRADVILAWLQTRGFQIVTTIVDAALTYDRVDYRRATAIVLGSEDQGLSTDWRSSTAVPVAQSGEDLSAGAALWQPVRIPMQGAADSLNVSAAAAVLFYEAQRQRAFSPKS